MESLNFSKNLLKLRKERKITQENLANYLGVTKAAIKMGAKSKLSRYNIVANNSKLF